MRENRDRMRRPRSIRSRPTAGAPDRPDTETDMRGRSILGAGVCWAVLGFSAAPADGPAAWTVEAVTRSGARYSGVVVNTPRTAGLFDGGGRADFTGWDEKQRVELRWFNGLSGSISLKVADFVSLEQ